MSIAASLRKLPPDYYIKLSVDGDANADADAEGRFLSACLMRTPPDGGWPSRGAYFQAASDSPMHQQAPEPFRFDDACLLGVSAAVDNPELLERLLGNAITKRWP